MKKTTKKTYNFLCIITLFLCTTVAQTQIGTDIDGAAANDCSKSSVSLSNDSNRMAIGAPINDGTGNNAVHVRIYS